MKFSVAIYGNEPLPQIVQQVKLAEDLGYHGAWIIDIPLLCRELYVSLAACGLSTSRIALGPGVTMPHSRHASVTASAMASLNEIAEGRMRLGISIGNSALRTVGRRWATIAELEGYVSRVRGLLGNREVPFESGARGRMAWMESTANIPIYVAATGPRLTRAAVRTGDGVMLLRELTGYEEGLRAIREESRWAGLAPGEREVVAWLQTSLATHGRLARAHVQSLVAKVLQMCNLETFDPADRPAVRRIKEEYDFYEQTRVYGADKPVIPDKFIDMYALAGTPAEARERVKGLVGLEGLSEIIIAPQRLEGSRGPSVEWVIRAFAEEVMAYVS